MCFSLCPLPFVLEQDKGTLRTIVPHPPFSSENPNEKESSKKCLRLQLC